MADGRRTAPFQIQQQENKSNSLLCGVSLASSKVSQPLKTGFLCLSTTDLGVVCWGWSVCLVHQRMVGSTLGPLPTKCQDCNSHRYDTKAFFRHRQMPPEEQNCPQLRPTALRSWKTSAGADRNGIHQTSV